MEREGISLCKSRHSHNTEQGHSLKKLIWSCRNHEKGQMIRVSKEVFARKEQFRKIMKAMK